MSLYLGLFLLTVTFAVRCGKSVPSNVFFRGCVFFVWTVPAVVRYGVGTDYLGTYTMLIREALEGERTTEVGYYLFERLMLWISNDNGYFVLGGAAALTYILVLLALPKKRIVATLAWFFLTLYTFSFNGIRQSIALGWVLLAFSFLERRRLWATSLLMLIALSFHYSAFAAIVMILMALFLRRLGFEDDRRAFVFVNVVMLIAAIVGSGLLKTLIPDDSRYMEYILSEGFSEPVTLKLKVLEGVYVMVTLTIAAMLWRRNRLSANCRFLAYLCIMAACVRIASLNWEILRRFPYLTDFPIPFALSHIKLDHSTMRSFCFLAVLLVWFVIFVYSLIPKADGRCWHDALPYKTVFEVAHPEWEL